MVSVSFIANINKLQIGILKLTSLFLFHTYTHAHTHTHTHTHSQVHMHTEHTPLQHACKICARPRFHASMWRQTICHPDWPISLCFHPQITKATAPWLPPTHALPRCHVI